MLDQRYGIRYATPVLWTCEVMLRYGYGYGYSYGYGCGIVLMVARQPRAARRLAGRHSERALTSAVVCYCHIDT